MVLGESRRENGRGAVGRAFTASPWRLGGHPRRARRGLRRVAMRSFRRDRDGAAGGTARARPVAVGLGVQRRQGREREEKRE